MKRIKSQIDSTINIYIGVQGCGKTCLLANHLYERRKKLLKLKLNHVVLIHDKRVAVEKNGKITALEGHIGLLSEDSGFVRSPKNLTTLTLPSYTFWDCEAEEVADFAMFLAKKNGLASILIIDELDEGSRILGNNSQIYKVLNHGRPYPIDMFGTTRRTQNIDKTFLSLCKHLYLFQIKGDGELKKIKATLSTESEVDILIKSLPHLKVGQYFSYHF